MKKNQNNLYDKFHEYTYFKGIERGQCKNKITIDLQYCASKKDRLSNADLFRWWSSTPGVPVPCTSPRRKNTRRQLGGTRFIKRLPIAALPWSSSRLRTTMCPSSWTNASTLSMRMVINESSCDAI